MNITMYESDSSHFEMKTTTTDGIIIREISPFAGEIRFFPKDADGLIKLIQQAVVDICGKSQSSGSQGGR